jgi:hypothetical protein
VTFIIHDVFEFGKQKCKHGRTVFVLQLVLEALGLGWFFTAFIKPIFVAGNRKLRIPKFLFATDEAGHQTPHDECLDFSLFVLG